MADYASNISIKILSNYKIEINYIKKIYTVKVDHSIDGYNIDCDKKNMVIWGRPKLFNPASPQSSNVTILKINQPSIKKEIGIMGGVFDVFYLKNKPIVYIESGMEELLVNLTDGSFLEKKGYEAEPSDFEDCPDFFGKSYRRYPE
ncbi:hypothetical protein [Methylovorus glucosotrophus]|nr:hypothetical protein [Methylovorus glucosotrophus]